MSPVHRLRIEALDIRDAAGRPLLARLDLALEDGQCLCLIGESGAGKSLVCAAVAGTLSPELTRRGRIWVGESEVTAMTAPDHRGLWSRSLFLLPQEPWTALAPARATLAQVGDMPRLRSGARGAAIATRLLECVGLDPRHDGAKRPRALSGGMAQRAAMATTMGAPAGLILVDEPTKGLDPDRRALAEAGLRSLLAEGRAILLVTHDLALASRLADAVVVMRNGEIVERGTPAEVLGNPRHAFTRALVHADPRCWPLRHSTRSAIAVTAKRLTIRPAANAPVVARDLDFAVARGGITGLRGPSGCGKTTLGDTVIGLLQPQGGTLSWSAGSTVQKIYQDPGAAFAPWRSIRATLGDVLPERPSRAALNERCRPTLSRLGLSVELLERTPGSVSGGELQRLSLARALLSQSDLIFADEPTSRLDALSQRGFMALLGEAACAGQAILLASHDADILRAMADEVITLGPARPASALTTPDTL